MPGARARDFRLRHKKRPLASGQQTCAGRYARSVKAPAPAGRRLEPRLPVRAPAMNHFTYIDGELHAEAVPVSRIAASVGTPFYCYSTATLERHYRVFAAPFPKGTLIAFSVKANSNLAVLRTLAQLGAGADVVSGGELKKALAAGIPADRIVFSGVGKTRAEMRAALAAR